MQSIIESQEAAAEELRSANEEAQATNEELDTAKEELQASNEELNTLNDELRARNLEQSSLNSDLRKLLESINVPLVMVGKNLHLRWFTPSMEPLLNLLPTDQGRLITDLHSAVIPNFGNLLTAALAGEQNRSIEIESPSGTLAFTPHPALQGRRQSHRWRDRDADRYRRSQTVSGLCGSRGSRGTRTADRAGRRPPNPDGEPGVLSTL